MKKVYLAILGVVILLIIVLFASYNGFITLNEKIDGQWAQVETQYQRRFDLIPNLEASVRGVMVQEREVFTALADARSRYAGAQSVDQKAVAASQVETSLGRLIAVMENYPQLKSSDNVNTLMVQIEGTENRISVERKNYNELVQIYNVKVKRIPGNILAMMFGFEEKPYFDSVEGSENAPQVDLTI